MPPKTQSLVRASGSAIEYAVLDAFTGVAPHTLPQIQPNIIDFAEHPEFCGKVLYPRQKTLLKLIFLQDEFFDDFDHHVIGEWIEQSKKFDSGPPNDVRIPEDIYDRIRRNKEAGRTHFREIIDVGGRRGGKGYIGGMIGAYLTYETLRLDDPQRFYGIDADKDLYINIVATSTTQARKYLFADVASCIISCKALRPYIWKVQEEEIRIQTPANIRHIADLKQKRIKINKDIASLRITANSSTSASGRGGAAYAQMFDEFAHVIESESSRSASEIYEAYTPSLDQIGVASLIYIPSSPYTQVGKFHDLYQAAFETDEFGNALYPEMLVVQHPSWSLYEDWEYDKRLKRPIQQYDDQMRQLEQRNPQKFKVERRARFASTMNAYLDPEIVDRMFEPFPSEGDDNRVLLRQNGEWSRMYRFHNDPGKSQANFCCAGGHTELGPDGFYHCYIDYMKVWQPSDFPPDPVAKVPWVDYVKITDQLIDVTRRFPISEMSFDQWNNVMAMQTIRNAALNGVSINQNMLVRQVTFTAQENWKRYEQFKTIAYMGWVHIPVYLVDVPSAGGPVNLASEEMKFLVEKNGKVEKQEAGPIQTKDLSDCIMVVTTDLLADQIAMLEGDAMTSRLVLPAVPGDYTQDTQRANQAMARPSSSARGRMSPFDQLYQRRGRAIP